MPTPLAQSPSNGRWTVKKPVTTLAIAPQSDSLTRTARMAYNVMIFLAQNSAGEEEGGFTAPLSEIVKGYMATTRDSSRVRGYIEQMCSTVVKWFPLSASDEGQATLEGLEPVEVDPTADSRIFTLLSEARFTTRAGEQWVTWFFPPTIRDIVVEPTRWAQLDIREMATLSTYAAVALYEICARYRDAPGGLTNRAPPEWWTLAMRHSPDTKPREWRKFKNETLNPAITEINERTGLEVRLEEYKRGRVVVEVQFTVKRKPVRANVGPVDLSLVERAIALGIRERDLDHMADAFGEDSVRGALDMMEGRQRAQPTVPINNPLGYIRTVLKNGAGNAGPLFEKSTTPAEVQQPQVGRAREHEQPEHDAAADRLHQVNAELDSLSNADLEAYAKAAHASILGTGLDTPATLKRFVNKQYRSPLIWDFIRNAYATEKYGPNWRAAA